MKLEDSLAPLRLVMAVQTPSIFYKNSFGVNHSFPIIIELRDSKYSSEESVHRVYGKHCS